MALAARQPNEPEHQTYKDLLDGSVGIYVPFNKKSSYQEIEQKLQGLKPPQIKALLRDRRARLQKTIAYIDIEASPHSLPKEFLSDMMADFNKQIHIVINKIPNPGSYIGNKQAMSDSFKLVVPALENAIAALKTRNDAIGALNIEDDIITVDLKDDMIFTLIQGIIQKNSHAYESLLIATGHLEAGLQNWDMPVGQPGAEVVDIEPYVTESINRLQEQRKTIGSIYDALLYRPGDEPFGRPALEKYECRLRKEVLATVLPILQPEMRNDEALQKRIADSALGVYDAYKSAIISSLRKAKIALNLALDEYEYIKSPLILTSEHLGEHLTACITHLENALKDWK